ncbi:hypothetical protein TPHA_0I00110 [Tetrapisispora phaffii CBS 4417]|uniref:Endoplasmic oxidoreductin-1 n=1 Tax=Tetrapisispora phaffii (strain ATCC 24235 / CBS 4417 / NBRC 1672 / NRRL Y-8282 / UCD 70-5) TaxID=1071381 RepID=G8BX90_TETPH|nr:hypothetical protein TPHA_0I00110 [Tetrapisispora phaffii CBS 4417]CCE64518.1 hypothetical protein TPHA_0I00110 [Tetrapisispora phaffii CBS 4417]
MKFNKLIIPLVGISNVVLGETLAPEQEPVLEAINFCKMDKDEKIGSTCEITFQEINEMNKKIRPDVISLVATDFFKYFKLNLYKQCPFWEDNNAQCLHRACAVDVVEDWDSLPEYWQPDALGSFSNDSIEEDSTKDDECKFLDQLCAGSGKTTSSLDNKLEDESNVDYCDTADFANRDSVLVDLSANPERFTGYGGKQAGQVWQSIYQDNCFTVNEASASLAKDVFYRLVSGLHASIGTHLSNEYLNTETGKWEPNLDLFMARVGNFPERVSNIYFNYAIISKALWKIQPYLKNLEFCNSYDESVKTKIIDIISQFDSRIFNEDLVFEDDLSLLLKDEFRQRFKNVTEIMDCVHCDRCRLWGKVQTTGYATSLKILFELDDADEETKQNVVDKLTKYELIALFNTLDRLSKSIDSINNFERLYNERLSDNGSKLANYFQMDNFFKVVRNAGKLISESMNEMNKSLNNSLNPKVKDERPKEEKKMNEFTDLDMSTKKRRVDTDITSENRWKKAWKHEIHNLNEALTFLWRSYVDLPRNLFNMTLSIMSRTWNKFVGVDNYVNEHHNSAEYTLDLQ